MFMEITMETIIISYFINIIKVKKTTFPFSFKHLYHRYENIYICKHYIYIYIYIYILMFTNIYVFISMI